MGCHSRFSATQLCIHTEIFFNSQEEIHLPCYSPFDRLRGYQRLFAEALARLEDAPIEEAEYTSKTGAPTVIEGLSKECVTAAQRDGLEMLDSHDFRFLSVFLILSWIGLQSDRDALQAFERRCIRPDLEPGDQVRIGLEILREASETKLKGKKLIEPDR